MEELSSFRGIYRYHGVIVRQEYFEFCGRALTYLVKEDIVHAKAMTNQYLSLEDIW